MTALKELLRDGISEEVRKSAGAYLNAYLVGWPEDLREARLKQKFLDLKTARAKALDIIDGMED